MCHTSLAKPDDIFSPSTTEARHRSCFPCLFFPAAPRGPERGRALGTRSGRASAALSALGAALRWPEHSQGVIGLQFVRRWGKCFLKRIHGWCKSASTVPVFSGRCNQVHTHCDRNGSVLAETQSSSEQAAGPRGAQGRALRRGNSGAPEWETPWNRDLSSMGEHRVPRKYIGVEENDFK